MRRIKKITTWQIAALCLLTCFIPAALKLAQAQTGGQLEVRIPGVPAGYTIIEGDIQMPISVVNAMRQQQQSPATPQAGFQTNLWPNGIVPFQFELNCEPTSTCATAQPSGCVGLARIGAMLDAMKVLEDVANVDFRQCPNNSCGGNYVHIRDTTNDTVVAPGGGNVCQGTAANSSPVGVRGGRQTINIVSWTSKFIIVHELLHTLGFIHEQSRPDRDAFVDVTTFCGNVTGGCLGATYLNNFPRQANAASYGPYDFDSVMHYGQCSFSSSTNCPAVGLTIIVKAPFSAQWQAAIGQRDHLSNLDRLTVSFLYPQGNWRFVDATNTARVQFGSFLDPYQSLAIGINATPVRGTLWLQPGAYFSSVLTKQITIKAPLGGVTIRQRTGAFGETLATVSAASYNGEQAAESIAAAFGENLANGTASATSLPLPTTLAGTTVKVKDADGTERDAPLFFVSPGQINYLLPTGTSGGVAQISVLKGGAVVAAGTLPVTSVAPGLFSANSSGEGVAAAVALRVRANGAQEIEPVSRFDAQTGRFVSVPIDLGPEGEQVFLILFGTGFRGRSALEAVTAAIGDDAAEVLFAGGLMGFAGLDQANVRLPRSLSGKGEVSILFTVDNRSANEVTVNIK